jgi:threonine/homoserine/homoserine lactone efflux protein
MQTFPNQRRAMPELTAANPLWLYLVLVAGIIVLPGMDMAFVMASTLANGRRAGAAAVAGIVLGGALHVLLSGLGLGLLLVSAPQWFNALLLVGAAYVAWMGWCLVRGTQALGEVSRAAPRPAWATLGQATATCLLNPKAYVFMLAVFPQFLQPQAGHLLRQAVVLGSITAGVQVLVYGSVVMGTSGLRGWLRGHGTAQVALGRAVGWMLLGVAAWTAWRGWRA